ncbi:MAG: putative transposase [Planctomycetaceae bacterium]|jgi:putative transposase
MVVLHNVSTLSASLIVPAITLFSRVRQIAGRVKRWRGGDMRHRWCVAGILRAEDGFRKVRGYKDLPQLIETVERLVLDKQKQSR